MNLTHMYKSVLKKCVIINSAIVVGALFSTTTNLYANLLPKFIHKEQITNDKTVDSNTINNVKEKDMKLFEIIQKLLSFKTITGNLDEINKCLNYIKSLLKPSGAIVDIYKYDNASPVIFARNTKDEHLDVLVVGHIDVVPAKDEMFTPKLKDGKLYGRGTLDMKSFAAVAINSMQQVMEEKLPLKFGFVLSTDEEVGSDSLHAFLDSHSQLKADIVLDVDVAGDITKIITKCKNPVIVKLIAKGQSAHGSTPWDGIDANEQLFKTWQNIRKLYPEFSLNKEKPKDIWINTVHFATIKGGEVFNVISGDAEAVLDFRLTEKTSIEDLKKTLDSCMEQGVNYEIPLQSVPVVVDENDSKLLLYKSIAEETLKNKVEFQYEGGATDGRLLYQRGSFLIMHSGTGEGMHADGEYVVLDSVNQFADIQMKFLRKLAEQKTNK